MDKTKSPSLLNLAFTALIVIVALVYAIVAISTEDVIWFLPAFNEYPEEIEVNCYGSVFSIYPEDEAYNGLVAIINETLSGRKNYDPLTLSVETYDYYRTSDSVMVLELFYTYQVRVHSFYKFFSNLDSIIIPLDGRHSKTDAIFGRSNGPSTAGSLHYMSMPDVRVYIESQGICNAP